MAIYARSTQPPAHKSPLHREKANLCNMLIPAISHGPAIRARYFGLQGLCPDLGYRGKGKEPIHCSNDPLLGGDPGKMNPEDLLLSSLSACHMLWYLHLASDAGITVIGISGLTGGNG
ncbi:OsmC family protein [Klebsiella variicola subsp. variicola]|nr:OsmC family protein [Klebsiella variicola subsp. variicola]